MAGNLRVRRVIARTFWRFSKWRFVPEQPVVTGSRVILGAPHTSNWDFVLMIAIAWSSGLHIRWLGKIELFAAPFGDVMRSLGGIPVDRKNPSRVVQEVTEVFSSGKDVALVITPEGTRGKGANWRSGFYRIARGANVPVSLGFVDATTQTCGIGPTMHLTGNVAADMDRIREFYADKSGMRPADRVEPRLSDESGTAE